MAYNLYTSEVVFLNANINSICNAIMDALENQFTAPTVNAAFGLTGTVAKIIQGDPNEDVKVIAFATSSQAIYDWLYANITTLISTTGKVGFSDRFQVINSMVYLEVWFREDPITLINTNGIYSEDKTEIPAHIL